MGSRLALQSELVALFDKRSPAVSVYFQPPSNIHMNFPCIRYKRDRDDIRYADDRTYSHMKAYQITCISRDADDDMIDTIQEHFPMCRILDHYVADNLYHDIALLYY